MSEALLTTLTIENYHPSTVLSMDSSSSSHEDSDHRGRGIHSEPVVDINLPLPVELGVASQMWNDTCDLLDVGLGPQVYETIVHIPKVGKKCAKRADTIWGAWFFFNFYFKPVVKESSKSKVTRDANGLTGFSKSDLKLDSFLVQHDMENIYMWVFKERPESALGKMQLRSYMNGHSRQGERPFPFSVDRGFVRSHKMQRKHYRGLSNPQCVHGIELVSAPDLNCVDEIEKKRWVELTGRDLNFALPNEASDFETWRNLPPMEFEVVSGGAAAASLPKSNGNHRKQQQQQQMVLHTNNGLNLSSSQLPKNIHHHNNNNGDDHSSPHHCNKRQKKDHNNHHFTQQQNSIDSGGFLLMNSNSQSHSAEVEKHQLHWVSDFTGVMKEVRGPVTGAKTIYEDDKGFLIIVSLPFADLQRVKVTWRNANSHGVVKICCASTAGLPLIKRHGRMFKLTDPNPEHCPPGDFVREITLPTWIPDDAKLEAYCDESGTVLEILVPKQRAVPEEHEVRVCLRPAPRVAFVDLQEALV